MGTFQKIKYPNKISNSSNMSAENLDKNIPIVVTGVNGYVSQHVTKLLLENGYKVKGTVRSLANKQKYEFLYNLTPDAKDKIQFIEANLNDNKVWDDVLKGAQAVLHVASPVPFEGISDEEMIKAAVEGMKAITQAALKNGVKKLIYTSSGVTQLKGFGKKGEHITADTWADPESMDGYAKSKYYSEKELWNFYNENKDKINVVTVLPAVVVGPVFGNGNISSMGIMKEFLGPIPGYLKEESVFPITKASDLGLVHFRALESKAANGKRLIGNNHNLTTKQILKLLDVTFSKEGYTVNNKETTIEEMQKAAKGGVFGAALSLIAQGAGAHLDHSETEKILGLKFESPEESIIEGLRSLIKYGILVKN